MCCFKYLFWLLVSMAGVPDSKLQSMSLWSDWQSHSTCPQFQIGSSCHRRMWTQKSPATPPSLTFFPLDGVFPCIYSFPKAQAVLFTLLGFVVGRRQLLESSDVSAFGASLPRFTGTKHYVALTQSTRIHHVSVRQEQKDEVEHIWRLPWSMVGFVSARVLKKQVLCAVFIWSHITGLHLSSKQ